MIEPRKPSYHVDLMQIDDDEEKEKTNLSEDVAGAVVVAVDCSIWILKKVAMGVLSIIAAMVAFAMG